jgi:hypothetical protein
MRPSACCLHPFCLHVISVYYFIYFSRQLLYPLNFLMHFGLFLSVFIPLKVQTFYFCVRFEILAAVTMKNAVFWDVASCRSCVNRRFGETYRLHFQGRKIRERGTSLNRWLAD